MGNHDRAIVHRRTVTTMALAGAAGGVAGLGYAAPASADGKVAPLATRSLRATDVLLDPLLETRRNGVRRTAATPTAPYSMVGFTWRGEGPTIRIRTRHQGRWTGWQVLPHLHDHPDESTGEGDPTLSSTQPLWVGRCNGIQVEVAGGEPTGMQMALIDPGSRPADARLATPARLARAGKTTATDDKPTKAPRPEILSRQQWGADDSWRDGKQVYIRTIQQVHIHHTVTGNDYSAADVPGLIRGMYRYHTYNLGWSDIGYNFLVDKYGRIWLGRAGGAGKLVRGAHTLGFNDASTGFSCIGNFDQVAPTKKMLTALVHLGAWKLDHYGRKPAGWTKVYSHGSDRFPSGRSVKLPVIDGHRDTNETACPGSKLYAKLPGIRSRTQARVDRFDPVEAPKKG